MGVFHVFKIVQIVPNRATHHILSHHYYSCVLKQFCTSLKWTASPLKYFCYSQISEVTQSQADTQLLTSSTSHFSFALPGQLLSLFRVFLKILCLWWSLLFYLRPRIPAVESTTWSTGTVGCTLSQAMTTNFARHESYQINCCIQILSFYQILWNQVAQKINKD